MKVSRIYIIGVLIFMALIFLFELALPKQFVWTPTFNRYDYEPLGCAIFDDVVSSSLSGQNASDTLPAYSVSDKTLYQLSMNSTVNRSILIVTENLLLSEVDRDALLEMLERGCKVMLVASGFNRRISDTLHFDYSYNYYYLSNLRRYATSKHTRDTLYWAEDSIWDDKRNFLFFPHLMGGSLSDTDSLYTVLSMIPENKSSVPSTQTSTKRCPNALTRAYGRGQITIVSSPLIFTNYGMLDGDNSDYIFRLLKQLDGLPIVRVEAYGKPMPGEEKSFFSYLLSQPPLRWGLYLTMIVILLFMIFTARREQRPIPVIRRPANKTVEFVQLIGTLYFQKRDHAGLVKKKFVYFAEILRRTIQVDVEDEENDAELANRISQKTGVGEEIVYRLLTDVRPVVEGSTKIDERKMRRFVEEMNEIINHI